VSSDYPYDLCCIDPEGVEWHVEVKGTTSDGSEVLLTPNEVRHAQDKHPRVVLFVLAGIKVEGQTDDLPLASGGAIRLFEPWNIDLRNLTPPGYTYSLGRQKT